MSYNLFLDDVREPPAPRKGYTALWPKWMRSRLKTEPGPAWIVVRSFDEAVDYVELHGMPAKISFDHDLGDGVPTGFDFAKWLVNRHLDGTDLLPKNFSYVVHSANPPGAANIKGLLDNFLNFLKAET